MAIKKGYIPLIPVVFASAFTSCSNERAGIKPEIAKTISKAKSLLSELEKKTGLSYFDIRYKNRKHIFVV